MDKCWLKNARWACERLSSLNMKQNTAFLATWYDVDLSQGSCPESWGGFCHWEESGIILVFSVPWESSSQYQLSTVSDVTWLRETAFLHKDIVPCALRSWLARSQMSDFLVSWNLGHQRHSQFKWGPLPVPAHNKCTAPASQLFQSAGHMFLSDPGSLTFRILAKKYRPYTMCMQHPSRIWGHIYLKIKCINISTANP